MKILCLIFTLGGSVDSWVSSGIFDREKILYEKLLENNAFDKIVWLTYGNEDKKHLSKVNDKIEIIEKPKIFNLPGGNLIYSLFAPLIQRKYLKSVDFVKTNQMLGSWTAVITAILFRKKLIIRSGYTLSINAKRANSSWFLIKFYEIIEKLAYWRANKIIFTTLRQLDYAKKMYDLKNKEIRVIPNFIEIDKFSPQKKDGQGIIYVGRLHQEKNLLNLIKAVAKTNYQLDLYGKGPQENEILNYLSKDNIKNVNLKGVINNDDLPAIFSNYDLFVLTSHYEGMPKSLIEAMSCGLPCLGTNVNGINEIIDNNINGVLCALDSESILTGIEKIIKNSSFAEKISQGARKTILEKYSLDLILKKETELYE